MTTPKYRPLKPPYAKYPYDHVFVNYKKALENLKNKRPDPYLARKIAERELMIKKTTTSRVFKRFMKKVGKYIGIPTLFIISWISISILISILFSIDPNAALLITTVSFIILPMIGFFLYTLYKDSKREIAEENKQLMRDLNGF